MNKNIKILTAIIVILGGILLYFIISSQNNEKELINNDNSIDEVKQEQPISESVSTEQNPIDSKKSSYIEYSKDNIKMAENTKIVLFFHASWCPTCRSLNSDIEENISKISPNITILKTDYDKETELRKKYSVTSQHTLVQVDKNGTLIKKWSGSAKLENIVSEIN